MTDSATTTLVCPKCASPMRSYERSGLIVDQCTGCRGLFLDRGELERLIEAQDTHYGASTRATQPLAQQDSDEGPDGESEGRSGRRRRGGFLGDLSDFGD